jgi:hypothetical protein
VQQPETGNLKRVFDTYPVDLGSDIYWTLVERSKAKQRSVTLVTIALKSRWLAVEFPFLFNCATDGQTHTGELVPRLEAMAVRARSLGDEMGWVIEKSKVVPQMEVFASAVAESINERLKRVLSHQHASQMSRNYLKKHDTESALFHAALSQQYGASSENLNNIGYVL